MIYLEIAIVVVLIIVNGLLSMAELAIVSSRRARLQALVDREVVGSRRALALAANPGKFLSTVQVGITLIGILSGAFSGATAFMRRGGMWRNGDDLTLLLVHAVADNYFELLGVRPALGWFPDPKHDYSAESEPPIILTNLWSWVASSLVGVPPPTKIVSTTCGESRASAISASRASRYRSARSSAPASGAKSQ